MGGINPWLEADIMRCMSGSSHIVQMEMASFAYQDGEEHSYIVLEWVLALRRVVCCKFCCSPWLAS